MVSGKKLPFVGELRIVDPTGNRVLYVRSGVAYIYEMKIASLHKHFNCQSDVTLPKVTPISNPLGNLHLKIDSDLPNSSTGSNSINIIIFAMNISPN